MHQHKRPDSSEGAASEALGGVMLISIVVLAVSIIGVVLTSQGTPQQIPALDAVISNYGSQIQIFHNGGDTLQKTDIEILVDGSPLTFKKGGSDAGWTFWSPGESLVADVPSVPKIVRVIYKGPSGSKTTLATADFSPSGLGNPGPISTSSLQAAFTASPSSGAPPLVVQFTDYSAGSPVGWNWAFDDGGSAGGQNPTHAFLSSGTYTVRLTVTNASGSTSSVTHPITVSTNPPSPSGISPGQGIQGTSVPISVYGTGFINGAAIPIRLKRAGSTDIVVSSVGFVSSTTLTGTVSIPAGAAAGSWDVEVTNPDSQSGTLTNGFVVTTPSGPAVSAITPDNSFRTPLLGVTVAGSNFKTGATLVLKKAGSPDLNSTGVVLVSSNMITGNFNIATAAYGQWDVVVTNTDGQSGILTNGFRVNAPIPMVTGISPISGPLAGITTVTVTGTNLTDASSVTFGGTNGTILTNTDTQITVTYPTKTAGIVDVRVTTLGGTSAITAGDQFTYIAIPAVTSISPASGPAAGATVTTITGTNLSTATAVKFGGNDAASFSVTDDSHISATSPAGSAGVVDVRVTTIGGTSAMVTGDQFTYVAAPTVTLVSPATGSSGGLTVVTISGTGFTSSATVAFGSNPATGVNYNSATSLTATSPAGSAGIVDVRVTTTGGTSATSSLDQFDYYTVQTFTSSTTWTVPAGVSTVEFCVVAGGGGGGGLGGGGGAGGFRIGSFSLPYPSSQLVTIGGGGAGGSSGHGSPGTNSIFGTTTVITATGGGGGGTSSGTAATRNGGSGGSGGGAARGAGVAGAGNTPSTTPSQGNSGGTGLGSSAPFYSGGGGGAGTAGGNAASTTAGSGGTGGLCSLNGVTYAGGGGGGATSGTAGGGGAGGGGAGSIGNLAGTAGGANTGGGGGGSGSTTFAGGTGGSGIIIIKYY